MNKTLAQGHKWMLTQEGDRVYLSLVSEYGTVEFLAKDVSVLRMLESIAREYDKLKEQEPLEQTMGEEKRLRHALDEIGTAAASVLDEENIRDWDEGGRLGDALINIKDIVATYYIGLYRRNQVVEPEDEPVPDNPLDADWVQPDDA